MQTISPLISLKRIGSCAAILFGASLASNALAAPGDVIQNELVIPSNIGNTGISVQEDVPDNADEEELPYGLYFIPWSDTSPTQVKSAQTRLYVQPLSPIDIEVFEREVYYDQFLSQDSAQ